VGKHLGTIASCSVFIEQELGIELPTGTAPPAAVPPGAAAAAAAPGVVHQPCPIVTASARLSRATGTELLRRHHAVDYAAVVEACETILESNVAAKELCASLSVADREVVDFVTAVGYRSAGFACTYRAACAAALLGTLVGMPAGPKQRVLRSYAELKGVDPKQRNGKMLCLRALPVKLKLAALGYHNKANHKSGLRAW
jgi:hypothetical protein